MVVPARCFERLPPGVDRIEALPLHEHNILARFPRLAGLLGVRKAPTCHDWAWCTLFIGDSAGEKAVNPNEMIALKEIVKELVACHQDDAVDYLDVMLPDKDECMVAANQLVWPDRVEYEERSKARFVSPDIIDGNVVMGNKLCKLTRMSKLSDCVKEMVSRCSLTEPSKEDVCLEELIRSGEFAEGYAALMERSGTESVDRTLGCRVRVTLASIEIKWVSELITHLHDSSDEKNDKVMDSEKPKIAFYENVSDARKLWLTSGVLTQHGESLTSVLGAEVRRHFHDDSWSCISH